MRGGGTQITKGRAGCEPHACMHAGRQAAAIWHQKAATWQPHSMSSTPCVNPPGGRDPQLGCSASCSPTTCCIAQPSLPASCTAQALLLHRRGRPPPRQLHPAQSSPPGSLSNAVGRPRNHTGLPCDRPAILGCWRQERRCTPGTAGRWVGGEGYAWVTPAWCSGGPFIPYG